MNAKSKFDKSSLTNWAAVLLLFFGLPFYFSLGVEDDREWFNAIEPVASWCNDHLDGRPHKKGRFSGASELKKGLTDDITRCLTNPEYRQDLAASRFNPDHWVRLHRDGFERLSPNLMNIETGEKPSGTSKGLMTMSSPLKDFLDKEPPPPFICIDAPSSLSASPCPSDPGGKNNYTAAFLSQIDHRRLHKACNGWCLVELAYIEEEIKSQGLVQSLVSFKITGRKPEEAFYRESISDQQQRLKEAEAETKQRLTKAIEEGKKKPDWIPELVF